MPPADNKRAVVEMLEAFNTGNTDIVDKLVDPKLKDATPFPGTKPTREGLKMQIQYLRSAFPDVKFSIEHIAAEKETVAYRWKMVGTQAGRLMGPWPDEQEDHASRKRLRCVQARQDDRAPLRGQPARPARQTRTAAQTHRVSAASVPYEEGIRIG